MKTCYIYMAGGTGVNLWEQLRSEYDVKGFIDPYPHRFHTREKTTGLMIEPVESLVGRDFDVVFSADYFHPQAVRERFLALGLPAEKLDCQRVTAMNLARLAFVRRFAQLREKCSPEAAVAELGVYQGDFAEHINRCFPDRPCYLFDTFSGFDSRDFDGNAPDENPFTDTGPELVLRRMPHPEQVILRPGYFPETTEGIDARFLFVNIDPDLYQPILNGLRWFWPRMVAGGVILVHDYFMSAYPHVREAVHAFRDECGEGVSLCPIGDDITVALYRPGAPAGD